MREEVLEEHEEQPLLERMRPLGRAVPQVVALGLAILGTVVGVVFACSHGSSPVTSTSGNSVQLSSISQGHSVDCGLPSSSKALTLLSSSALAGPELKRSFREMVLELPDCAWDGGNGAAAKAAAKTKSAAEVEAADFLEPNLYSGLRVLIIEDASFLKNAMWDASNPNFPKGVNYDNCHFKTSKELVSDASDGFQGLDGGWGCNYESSTCGGLGGFGFDDGSMTHLSIFDLCATDGQKTAAFRLQSKGEVSSIGPAGELMACTTAFNALLEKADVLAVNGGNPDWLGFVFKKFAPELSQKIVDRVKDGSLIYLARSAGAMVGGSDFALTYEPKPVILDSLLAGDTQGLALAGNCAIRPHYKAKWDLPTSVLDEASPANFLLTPNGESLVCLKAECAMVGDTSAEGSSTFEDGDSGSVHLKRLVDVFDKAFDSYSYPMKPELHDEVPREPECHMTESTSLVILSSTALDNNEIKAGFRDMVLKLPDSAWDGGNGAAVKAAAEKKNMTDDEAAAFHEPELYSGLKVLMIEDASFLKNAMWDASNENFAKGVNYENCHFETSMDLVKTATDGFQGLDGGWGCNYESATCGGLGGFGFDEGSMTHISIFDLCASDSQKTAAFKLQSKGEVSHIGPAGNLAKCTATFDSLLEKADVLAVNGGNPDWIGFVLKKFAPTLGQKIVDRVKDGSLIYLARSAGAMVGGSDFALTYEPNPDLLENWLQMDTTGLGLAGSCAIRPHFKDKWDIATSLYEYAKRNIDVVPLLNGETLGCMEGKCRLYGSTKLEPSATLDSDDANVERLANVYDRTFDKFLQTTA